MGGNPLWIALIGLGILLVLAGGWLLLAPLRSVKDAVSRPTATEPCPELLAAWETLRGECEEARRAVVAVRAAADHRAAGERAARSGLGELTRAREAAERAFEAQGGSDRLKEDDRLLRRRAFAEARAEYEKAQAAARDDAARAGAAQGYEQRLRDIADPGRVDALRVSGDGRRGSGVVEAAAALARARTAEANAKSAADGVAGPGESGTAAALQAEVRATETCARAAEAEAAYRACVTERRKATTTG